MTKKRTLGIITIGLLCLVYFLYNPNNSNLFPKCPFFYFTGFKCPGCGSQRAIHAILHFNIIDAFKFNGLMVSSLPIIFLLFYAEMTRKIKPKLYIRLNNNVFIWTYFSIVVIWWIFRNIYLI